MACCWRNGGEGQGRWHCPPLALAVSLAALVQGCQCCVPWKPRLEFKARCLWGKGKSFHRRRRKKKKTNHIKKPKHHPKNSKNPSERAWEQLESKGSPGSAMPSELGRLCRKVGGWKERLCRLGVALLGHRVEERVFLGD